ncbi:cobalamin B12-binding domain-containing protein [Krasilnikovia sp. MM14-A1004]|uniref:cobalamin B12-binding domain-containing protein n=1 Tax=Krasilnikovia sp. MM14-A1004 TaxID=3373541 RepID=UPI00399C9D93
MQVANPAPDGRRHVVLTSMESDSHTWNLVFLQLVLEELGYLVTNLGACVPDQVLLAECLSPVPDLIVISSVNGHGYNDGMRVIPLLRSRPELASVPIVIGGKLGIGGAADADHPAALLRAGFDAVFADGGGVEPFRSYVRALPSRAAA